MTFLVVEDKLTQSLKATVGTELIDQPTPLLSEHRLALGLGLGHGIGVGPRGGGVSVFVFGYLRAGSAREVLADDVRMYTARVPEPRDQPPHSRLLCNFQPRPPRFPPMRAQFLSLSLSNFVYLLSNIMIQDSKLKILKDNFLVVGKH